MQIVMQSYSISLHMHDYILTQLSTPNINPIYNCRKSETIVEWGEGQIWM
jgi:hypothetical protein